MEEQKMERKNFKRMIGVIITLIALVFAVFTLTQCQTPGYEGMFANKDGVSADNKTVTDTSNSEGVSGTKGLDEVVSNKGGTQNSTDSSVSGANQNGGTNSKDVTNPDMETNGTDQVQIFQQNADGTTWFNSEEHNYSIKFPNWMKKKVTEESNLVLRGNSLGKEVLSEEENFTTPNFTINTSYFTYSKYTDGEFDTWFATLRGTPDEKIDYQGATLWFTAFDSDGPYMRRTFVPIAMSGAVQLDLTYYSTLEYNNEAFNKKVKEAFYTIIKNTQELFLSK